MDYSVAIILPNTLTYNTTKEVLKELNLDYPLYKATEHDAVSIANDLIARGTRIIILYRSCLPIFKEGSFHFSVGNAFQRAGSCHCRKKSIVLF